VRPPAFPLLSLAIKAFNQAPVAPGINPSLYSPSVSFLSAQFAWKPAAGAPMAEGSAAASFPSSSRPLGLFKLAHTLPPFPFATPARQYTCPSPTPPVPPPLFPPPPEQSPTVKYPVSLPSSPVHAWLISLPLSLLQGHLVASGPSCAVTPSAGSPPELAVDVELPLQRLLVNFVLAPVASAW
jgi:hypothetical protein